MPIWPLATLPWIAVALALARRFGIGPPIAGPWTPAPAGSPGGAGQAARKPPLVSIVVPARNEARNIERCVRSIMATAWPRWELIVVNDSSTDGTEGIARRVVAEYAGPSRVEVLSAPPLPAGWIGKQWACHSGVLAARGHLFLFTDADTAHGPDVLGRAVRSMDERGAAMLSVFGSQEFGTFWERLLMPQVVAFIVARFGNGEVMNASANPLDKIANGQFLLISRAWYDRVGGHQAVRAHVAEDMRLAQEVCRAGGSVQVVDGRGQITTRMYVGLAELMRGWTKNVYAAGRDTLPLGPVGHAVARAAFPVPTLWNVVPVALGAAAACGWFGPGVLWWAATCYAASAAFWVMAYREQGVSAWYALLHPLAGVMLFVLFVRAAWRGTRVEWKGRVYVSGGA